MTHKVRLHPGDECFEVAEGETVLAAGLRAGLHLPHSCRGGSCGACEATVLEGHIHYPRGAPAAMDAADAASGKVLLCQACARTDLVVEARAMELPEEVRIRRLPCRLESRNLLAPDVMQLTLKLPSFEPFVFLPGQYVDILLKDGRRRSFSMANPPHEEHRLELHVRRVPGGDFTGQVFGALKDRSLLRLEGPLGGFWLRDDGGAPALMVAGGTGYAPIKSMLRHLMHTGSSRKVHFYWGVRTPADLYEGENVSAWARGLDWLDFVPVMSEADSAWSGRRGWVHDAVLEDFPDLSGVAVYAAGPPPMIEAIQDAFPAHGLSPHRLYFDSFEYGPDRAGV
ncbi:MAG: CDP-6-deoxy-delta-3,4-glucoseen reductase [Gammaproteobacteria bacterium]